jgi:type I restriction enzyme, R subunit
MSPDIRELIGRLTTEFPLGTQIVGVENEKEFVRLYGMILRLRNILSAFDDFQENEILSERDYQDYQSIYIDIYTDRRPTPTTDKENINDDLVFEMELIKQIEVNIDYILMLLAKYKDSMFEDKEILGAIDKAINSSLELRSKKVLIESFIERINLNETVENDWRAFVKEQHDKDLDEIIQSENLKNVETRKFVSGSLRDGYLKTTGTDIDKILPPTSRFQWSKSSRRSNQLSRNLCYFSKDISD